MIGSLLDAFAEPQHLGRMPKKKAPELTDAERAKRIREMAREVEADETGEAFKRFLEKAAPPKKQKAQR